MMCNDLELELVAYHFGLTPDDRRSEIEAHLVGCGPCLRAFLDLKRAIETSEDGAVPSTAARSRLRRAVADVLSPAPKWSWWERPVAFAVAASVVLVAGATMRALTSGPGSPPYALADR